MRAATVEALTLFPLASSANCFFHASKPAAVLPHCAAPASLAIQTSATKAATVTALNCPPVVIQNLRPFAPDETLARHLCRDEASSPTLAVFKIRPRDAENLHLRLRAGGSNTKFIAHGTTGVGAVSGPRGRQGSPVRRQHPAMEWPASRTRWPRSQTDRSSGGPLA